MPGRQKCEDPKKAKSLKSKNISIIVTNTSIEVRPVRFLGFAGVEVIEGIVG